MFYYVLKLAVTAICVVAISEIAKRSTAFAALVASLPLTSLMALTWLHVEGAQPSEIADVAIQIFWLIIPSLPLFFILPMLLRYGLGYPASVAVSIAVTVGLYFASIPLLRMAGVKL